MKKLVETRTQITEGAEGYRITETHTLGEYKFRRTTFITYEGKVTLKYMGIKPVADKEGSYEHV